MRPIRDGLTRRAAIGNTDDSTASCPLPAIATTAWFLAVRVVLDEDGDTADWTGGDCGGGVSCCAGSVHGNVHQPERRERGFR